MTSQRNRLESVLGEIDAILGESGPRLPWVMSNDVQQQRQTLAKARDLLTALQAQQFQEPENTSPGKAMAPAAPSAGGDPTAMASSQVLQALLQEMQYLRGQTMEILDPLRNEVATLNQQRELLLQEVQQLQQQRLQLDQGPGAGPGSEAWEVMLQELTSHLDSHLSQQLQQSVKQLEASAANTYLLTQSARESGNDAADLTPSQRLEYLKQIQTQSDQLVMNLDRVLRTVFESLQQSIYSYQDSLNHGLNKMHTLGQQGEMMFNALISHLAQQMNQDTLAYLEANRARSSHPPQLPDSRPPLAQEQDGGDTNQSGMASPSQDETELNLDDLDLDLALNDDEVTLLQIDDEISQLQFDVDANADDDPSASPLQPRKASSQPAEGPTQAESPPPAAAVDPLQVLEQLDEAVPNPAPSVSLPDDSGTSTLETMAAATNGDNDSDNDDGDNALDGLYQSIFGDVIEAHQAAEQTTASGEDVPAATDSLAMETELAEDSAIADATVPLTDAESFDEDLEAGASEPPDALSVDGVASLLDSPPPEQDEAEVGAAQDSLDDLFGVGLADQLTDAEGGCTDDTADTIAQLDELLPESQPSFGDLSTGLTGPPGAALSNDRDFDAQPEDADFIEANTDEDLLASDSLPQAENYWLQVDQTLVDRLDADLTGLESGNIPGAADSPDPMADSFASFGDADDRVDEIGRAHV